MKGKRDPRYLSFQVVWTEKPARAYLYTAYDPEGPFRVRTGRVKSYAEFAVLVLKEAQDGYPLYTHDRTLVDYLKKVGAEEAVRLASKEDEGYRRFLKAVEGFKREVFRLEALEGEDEDQRVA